MVDGVRLLVMGTIERGRRGCACPENILLREVLDHLMLRNREHVVVDMEAGIEHLGRGTAEGVDLMLVVVEPGWASLETAARVASLAATWAFGGSSAVANKISGDGGYRVHPPESDRSANHWDASRWIGIWNWKRARDASPGSVRFTGRCCALPRRWRRRRQGPSLTRRRGDAEKDESKP